MFKLATYLHNLETKIHGFGLIFYIIPFVVLGIHWISIFPANLSTDSFVQLYQIETNQFSDEHPAAHTLFCKLLMQIYNSPATVIFFQILFLSLIVGYTFNYIWKKGVSSFILIPILVLWLCLEPVRNITCFFWKDIFYTIALLLLTLEFIKMIDKKEKISFVDIFLTTIALAGVTLFRHNGIVVFIFSIFILIYFAKKYGKKYLMPIAFALVVIVFVKTVVYGIFDVQPNKDGTKYALPAKAIVSVVYFDGNYTEEELKKIETLMPLEYIKTFYDLELGQGLLWRTVGLQDVPSFRQTLEGKEKLITELFLELFPKNMGIMLNDMWGSASLMLKLQIGDITKNANPELMKSGLATYWEYGNIFEHNMIYMLLLTICIILLIKYKKYENILVFIPIFDNILSIVISNISYESRYAYPTIICSGILIVYTIYVLKNLVIRRNLDEGKN